MFVIVDKSSRAVLGIQEAQPSEGAYDADRVVIIDVDDPKPFLPAPGEDGLPEWPVIDQEFIDSHPQLADWLAKKQDVDNATLTARQFFAASQAAQDFIRMTPGEQSTAIDGMNTAQLKAVIKYLAVAVSAAIKRDYL